MSLVDRLIRRAKRTPYLHLNHAGGTPYMERYWLLRSRFFAIRLHKIITADYDRHMHDHPWTFISIVLRGGYMEWRPAFPQFNALNFQSNGLEPIASRYRGAGSIALRRFFNRHLIAAVNPETWTLFISGPKRQSWGFYTPDGFVNWRKYPTCHAAGQVTREQAS